MPDTDTVSHARKFLQGEQLKFAKANELWKRLKEEDQFSLARQVLRQLREKPLCLGDGVPNDTATREILCRQEALVTSKDPELDAATRHEMADGLESAITAELGSDVEVETHIEPLQPQDASGREAPPERVKAVAMALSELAAKGRHIRDVHDVRVRETGEGEIVNFHCRVDPRLSVQSVHENVDALERALKEQSPPIKRVIGHAEPMR